jgi:glutamate--cysteine ligase
MIQEQIHLAIVENCKQVEEWFQNKRQQLPVPFYSSYDIRDSGYKVAPVDANIFPAGFNNICPADRELGVELAKDYISRHYRGVKTIVVLSEEHTKNAYYWENIWTIQSYLEGAGYEVKIALPRELNQPLQVESSAGHKLTVYTAEKREGRVFVDDKRMDLIICNNDFSKNYSEWVTDLETPMNPPHELGWYRRRKSDFFIHYNSLAGEFADLLGVDPLLLNVSTQLHTEFDINSDEDRDRLADEVDRFLEALRSQYQKLKVDHDPFVFIKNNAGTYGLGVIEAKSGDEVRQWSYRERKAMKAAKGGGGIDEVIIQEGIPSRLTSGEETAEPALYMIGCQLAGGFLRAHKTKGPQENLNSPGVVFRKLCVSDLKINVKGCPMENVYGWVAKLSLLAVSFEAQQGGITFRDYIQGGCK